MSPLHSLNRGIGNPANMLVSLSPFVRQLNMFLNFWDTADSCNLHMRAHFWNTYPAYTSVVYRSPVVYGLNIEQETQ